jgi:hypothetical protein
MQSAYASDSDIKVTPSASVYYQIGQLEQTFDQARSMPDKTWDQRCDVRLYLSAVVQERLRIIVGAEAAMVTQVQPPLGSQAAGATTTSSYAFPREGQGIYTLGDDEENSPLQIALGYFPFKYNPDASNMGEYLFRTGTYPPFIINDFDNCEAKLLGLRVTSRLFGMLRLDGLFTSETYYNPLGDYSLSLVAGVKPARTIDVGAGVSLSRVLPLDPKQTTRGIVYNSDAITPTIVNGDTLHYTFQGVKFMARVCFDPKPLLPEAVTSFFGKEDGKLYGETAILGLKNYGKYYNDLSQRCPVMAGFNIPTTKWGLDVLSLELEYFAFDYDQFSFPPGQTAVDGLNHDNFESDNMFHWSLFAQKKVIGGLSVKGLVGKDHYRNTGSQSPWAGVDNPISSSNDAGELCVAHGDWHYSIRVMYSF